MSITKIVLSSLGFLFLLIGVIGIFIPLLPTTPFILLAVFCFARSSERFHNWILNHKTLGPPVKQWHENRSIAIRHKITATLMMLISLIFLSASSRIPEFGKWGMAVFFACVLTFIWTRKS